jgi:hypothetical protein
MCDSERGEHRAVLVKIDLAMIPFDIKAFFDERMSQSSLYGKGTS